MFEFSPAIVVLQLAVGGEVAGGGAAGFLAGYSAKKILRVIKTIAIAFAGIQVFIVAFLERKGLITVHWDAFGESISGFSAGQAGGAVVNFGAEVFGLLAGVLPAAAGVTAGGFLGWKYAN